jgi:hypothetical protein
MVKIALFVGLDAKPGKETDLETCGGGGARTESRVDVLAAKLPA